MMCKRRHQTWRKTRNATTDGAATAPSAPEIGGECFFLPPCAGFFNKILHKHELTKEQHPEEVCAAAAEGAFLEGFAVLHQEEHVKHKIQPCAAAHLAPSASLWGRHLPRLTLTCAA